MKLYYEWGTEQLHKYGEELCGDNVAISRTPERITLALSDGMGSGVKASILATLTTQIALGMLNQDLALDEVVQTLTQTLPVCNVRKVAYSTFSLAQFFSYGLARVAEFDAPSTIVLRDRKARPIDYRERTIDGKTIHEAVLNLQDGDWVVFVSDGVLNAGMGGAYPLGWGWEKVAGFLEKNTHRDLSAHDVAARVSQAAADLYFDRPGDDVSIVVVKVRRKRAATILTGPPTDRSSEAELVSRFVNRTGELVVCGGTTAQIVAHHLGLPLDVDLVSSSSDVPPKGHMDRIDLVTEGILTLTKVRDLLLSGATRETVQYRDDGASELLRLLLTVDHSHMIVGQAVNPAHQNPDLPSQLGIRTSVVRQIAEQLETRGKEVTIEVV